MKRIITLMLALALFAAMFTACGSKEDKTMTTAEPSREASTEPTAAPTTVKPTQNGKTDTTENGNVSDDPDGSVNGSNEPMTEETTENGITSRARRVVR